VSAVIPPDTEADQLNQARAALAQMRKSGITTFMDAAAGDAQGAAFTALQKSGELTARAFFAIQIAAEDAAADPAAAVAAAATLANTYDQGEPQVTPGIRFRHLKLFGDGVVNAPADTGGLLTPYFTNAGTDAEPNWVPGTNTGADYFPPSVLNPLMAAIASSGFDPTCMPPASTVRQVLDAVAYARTQVSSTSFRPVIAHNETVAVADYPRYAQLDVMASFAFQWAQQAGYSVGTPSTTWVRTASSAWSPSAACATPGPGWASAATGRSTPWTSSWPSSAPSPVPATRKTPTAPPTPTPPTQAPSTATRP
jgi:predicted amidohydrolase YtcJ